MNWAAFLCKANSTDYRSVMSYAYNLTGVPANVPGGPNRIDYSSVTTPHYDWRIGRQPGELRFIPGQFGEIAGLDNAAQGVLQTVHDGEAETTSFDNLTVAMVPSVFDAYARTVGEVGRPNFPAFDSPTVHYSTEGTSVTGQLPIRGRNGSESIFVEVHPEHGQLTLQGESFVYTPAGGYVGRDSAVVRAKTGKLSSEQLTITFETNSNTTPTNPPPPGSTGSGSLGTGSSQTR